MKNNPEEIFSYEEKPDGVYITGAIRGVKQMYIPKTIHGKTIIGIDRKAFLGYQDMESVQISENIEIIGDWGFAKCRRLREVYLPNKEIRLGQQVFQDTDSLQAVWNDCGRTQEKLEKAYLLGAVPVKIAADYLFTPWHMDAQWYQNWDDRFLSILTSGNEETLRNLVYCAEEDMSEKQEESLKKQEENRIGLIFLRLRYDKHLTDTSRIKLQNYLQRQFHKSVTKEHASEIMKSAVWTYLTKQEIEMQRECFDILLKFNCITDENMDVILDALDKEHTELKAYLIKIWNNRREKEDFWDSL